MSTGRRVSDLEAAESSDGGPDERVSQAPVSGVQEGEKGRGSGRWTVAEQFVRDGFHYRLMRRPMEQDESTPRLTRREEEALFHASSGASNKRIAQLLGVAPSTVGVLLFRAASKLGVKNRHELLTAYERLVQAANGVRDIDDRD